MTHFDPDDPLYDPEDDDEGHLFQTYNPYRCLFDDPEDYDE